MSTILIIEDDESIGKGIAFVLQKDGYSVTLSSSLAEGLSVFANSDIDLIILDLNLPDGDGLRFCEEIRRKSRVPILVLTARDMESDEVAGLLAGADDYVTKPFSLSVLRARVESLLRRASAPDATTLHAGRFTIDTRQCRVARDGEDISVSATEYRLIYLLATHAGQILSKDQILAALWDHEGAFVDENTLSVNISRVRAKLEVDPRHPTVIKTVHGLGYMWVKA